MRPNYAVFTVILVLTSLLALHNSPGSIASAAAPSTSSVSMHLVGKLSGWNGTNPTITVDQGDTVSIILTSADISHQFAVDWDHDGAIATGSCVKGDNCSSVFGIGPGPTFTFTASFAPGTYVYFCTFHFQMVGSLIIRPVSSPPAVAITKISPNPASTGALVTVRFSIANPGTVSSLSVDWGDGTVTHPSTTATSDTHSYLTTSSMSQMFTINVTATNASGHGSATMSETVNDRPPTLTITSLLPNPVTTGQIVRVNFTASDPDGTISSITVNWGDGSAPDRLSASATSDTHSYNSTGTFSITLTPTDNGGSSTHVSSQPVTVTALPSPSHHHHGHHHHEHASGDEDHEETDTAPIQADLEENAE